MLSLPNFRTDGHRGMDVGLHTLRVRGPRRVRRHPLPEAEGRSRRGESCVNFCAKFHDSHYLTGTEHVVPPLQSSL